MLSHLKPLYDIPVVLLWGCAFLVIRKALSKALFPFVSNLVKRRIKKQAKNKKLDEEDKTFHIKETDHAIENLWFSIFYPIFTLWGWKILSNYPWAVEYDLIYKGIPQNDLSEDPELKMFYLAETGFYVQALFALVFIDQRMKDFLEYLIHHISTLIALTLSYCCGFHRIGTLILSLHDVTDIFLYSSKFVVEVGFRPIAAVQFAGFMLCYTFLRLMYFPVLIWGLFFNKYSLEAPVNQSFFRYIPESGPIFDLDKYGMCINHYCLNTWKVCGIALLALLCLHVFWYRLAWKVLLRSFGKDLKVYDIRKEGVEE